MNKDVNRKSEILERIEKAGNNEYKTEWDDNGIPQSKKLSEIKKGKKSRAKGLNFESKVRKHLEEQGWIVAKWPNNIEFNEGKGKIIPAKRKFNPFSRVLAVGTGFPDFIAFRQISDNAKAYLIWGIEAKTTGYLDKEEKEKCRFLLESNIFSDIMVARQSKNNPQIIELVSFKEKHLHNE